LGIPQLNDSFLMKYYIIAGEASGDLHGSNLMKALAEKDTGADFRIWGGDLMEGAGGKLVKHYKDLAFMGFVEVVSNLRTILHNIKFCKQDILKYQPDALILVDYPGFNLRISKWAHEQGIKVFYYISPQLWAWHSSRVKGIKASVDHMFVILPFEEAFYQEYDYKVDFVGHPLLDVIQGLQPDPTFRSTNQVDERPIIALLPGSRRQEITKMLEVMLSVLPSFPDHQFIIAGAPAIPLDFYENILTSTQKEQVRIVQNQTYDLLQEAAAALVTSGTATLETGLFKVPQIVCYKGNPVSYQIAKRLVNVKYISLVNLIVDRPLVKELIQSELTTQNLTKELASILQPARRQELAEGYAELHTKLGHAGASERTAALILEYLA
jgi:lipid-A-disaccharide synthase